MKFLKWLLISLVTLVLVIGIGLVAVVNLVDWNAYRDTIQDQTAKHTGRELAITGDLNPSFFPWTGISIGGVTLANAEGFSGDTFAQVSNADVRVEVLPLLKREINVKSVELHGLTINLQRKADGTTNWDDLAQRESTTTTETEEGTTTEVEGNSPTIAALAVGGINISGAEVKWQDDVAGSDAHLTDFNLETGAIELNKPFDFSSTFQIDSNSIGLRAGVKANAMVNLDLENQVYGLSGLGIDVDAKGETLPNGALVASLGGDVVAELANESVDISGLLLKAMGLEFQVDGKVTGLSSEPVVVATAGTNTFKPKEVLNSLGVQLPDMADASVMEAASMTFAVNASSQAVDIDDLVIRLDDSNITGVASLPNLTAAVPPVRFSVSLDAIDVDRYLPPVVEGEAGNAEVEADAEPTQDNAAGGDTPIELPLELIRTLDVDGSISAGEIKVANLVTRDLSVPVKAQKGVVTVDGLSAALYQGQLDATTQLDATGNTPAMAAAFKLNGIQAQPLLEDLLQGDAPISGAANIQFDLRTVGNSVNGLKAALNGTFNTAFTDGAVNGINIGYQLRRAKAVLTGNDMPEQADVKKTDFSSLSVSGTFTDGVMRSDDLDMRSPLLRLSGLGLVDLPKDSIDYTSTIKVTASTEGQGGDDLNTLNGVSLEVPVKATFAELAANPAKVLFNGIKDNISGNLQKEAEALARQKADALKAEAEAKLKAEEAKARERLEAEEAKARARLEEEQKVAQEKADAERARAEERIADEAEKAKDKLQKGLGGLLGN